MKERKRERKVDNERTREKKEEKERKRERKEETERKKHLDNDSMLYLIYVGWPFEGQHD